jgi:signal transduction histidine kinase
MKAAKIKSLKSYLKKYFFIIGVIIAIINAFMIVSIYYRGIDETSEVYLIEDAYNAQYLLKNELALPLDTSLIQYYHSQKKLPDQYVFANEMEHLGIEHFDFEKSYDYVLYFHENEQELPFFVVHSFSKSDETVVLKLTISQIIFMISIMVISFLLLSSLSIYRTINSSIGNLYNWVIQNKPESNPNDKQIFYTQKMKFLEISTIADRLNFYISNNQKRQDREKESIRSLSHEIRTPMAIIQAALDILDTKDIPQNISDKILKIKNANNEMIETSTLILNMWQSANEGSDTDCISVIDEIKNNISSQRFTNDRKDINFILNINESLVVNITKHSFQLLLTNIIGNIFKHSGSGEVQIYSQGKILFFKNKIKYINNLDSNWFNSSHGIGNTVIKTICDHLNWSYSIKQNQDYYIINIELI